MNHSFSKHWELETSGACGNRLLCLACVLHLGETFEQIFDKIVGMLASRRKPDERVRKPEFRASLGRNGCVRHRCRMAQQRFYAAETLAEREVTARRRERNHLIDRT